MENITKIYTVYNYNELSETAKEKANQWYLEGQEAFIFTEACNESIAALFPNSDLTVQYDLGYCQGDGLNIYGTINLDDIFEHIKSNFFDGYIGTFIRLEFGKFPLYRFEGRERIADDWEIQHGSDNREELKNQIKGKF